jgi:nuclear migration protein JNM1
LRREVEEVKSELERVKETKSQARADEGVADPAEDIRKLSDALDAVYVQRHGLSQGAEAHFQQTVEKFSKAPISAPSRTQQSSVPTAAAALSKQQQEHILAKAADFDQRLAHLEEVLGLNALNMPDVADKPPKPILHTLGDLEHQINAISSTNPTTIEAVGAKVRRLNQEAQAAQVPKDPASANSEGTGFEEEPERVAKINALYGTLATIESLSPTLPLVLERLRTLRMVHTSASTASATLDGLEKRQAEQANELKQWREALGKMEARIKEGEGVLTSNVKLVEDWVKDLESRVAKFS